MVSEEQLYNFFEQDIFDLDEDKIDLFFEKSSPEKIIKCLQNKLKLTAVCNNWERAWLLGRVFGDISNFESVDLDIYSWSEIGSISEKKAAFSFLSGYWDEARAHLETLKKLSSEIAEITSDNLKYPQELIFWGIEAVAVGYFNNTKLIESDLKTKDIIEKNLMCLKNYAVSVPDNSPPSLILQFNK